MFGWTELFVLSLWAFFWVYFGWVIAKQKGRWNGGRTGGALVLFGPLAVLVLLVMRPDEDVIAEEMVKKGTRKWCPFCVSAIPIQAMKCRHCGSETIREEAVMEQESSGLQA